MNIIKWNIIEEIIDPRGSYTQKITWVPPVLSGYIVQRVEIDDPQKLLYGYVDTYYEAWKVVNGKVVYDDNGRILGYDDCFSNCYEGFLCDSVATDNHNILKDRGISNTYISYNCLVYWVDDNNQTSFEISKWTAGNQCGIVMAGELKASYIKPVGLNSGIKRTFRADFKVE